MTAVGAAGASVPGAEVAEAAAALPGVGAPGRAGVPGRPGDGRGPRAAAPVAPPAGVALAGAAAEGAPLPSGVSAGKASLRRRTTGGSIVDAADFTYSPLSASQPRASLLEIPSSLAT